MTPTAADPALRDSFVGLVRALAGAHGLDPDDLEQQALAAERERMVRAAVARLPGRCAGLVTALLESPGYSYRELAEELSMPLGSIGPTRARCLACLRRVWQLGRVLQPE